MGSRNSSPTTQDAAPPRPRGSPISVRASKLSGEGVTIEAFENDTVMRLKELIQAELGIQRYQQQLLLGNTILNSHWVLSEHGVGDHAELTVLVGRPVPDWAQELGFTGDHPALLREYYATHSLECPEWFASDEEIWERLRMERQSREEGRKALKGWSHLVSLERDGAPSGVVAASPGQALALKVNGWVHNNNGDTCIQQLFLAKDTEIVGLLDNSVPQRGKTIGKTVKFKAPKQPGTYMLWRMGDLQYTERDARANFERRHGKSVKGDQYPRSFVGWLVVE